MPSWAEFIIGSALAEIASGKSDKEIIEKAKGTALYADTELWKEFLRLVKARRQVADRFGRK